MNPNLSKTCTTMSADIVGSSKGDHNRQADLVKAAFHAVERASRIWNECDDWIVMRSDGDGVRAAALAIVPKSWILWDFLNELHVGIREYNRNKNADHRLRLRVGIDCGEVRVDELNDRVTTGGNPLTTTADLRDCRAVRAVIDPHPDVILAVAVSDRFYTDVVPAGDRGLDPSSFQPITVELGGDKASRIDKGWLYLPWRNAPVSPVMPTESTREERTAQGGGNTFIGFQGSSVNGGSPIGIAMGDVTQKTDWRSTSSQTGSSDPASVVRSIRRGLDIARRCGRLDDEIYDAALIELRVVEGRLAYEGEFRGDSTVRFALREFRRLVGNIPELTVLANRVSSQIEE